jgi:U3 small nucleolar RNA-associated protein 4
MFWNGQTGTMIKSVQAHDADVLCLALDAAGAIVYSSGIDRKVVKLANIAQNSINQNDTGDEALPQLFQDWIIAGSKKYHTHDVRAMIYLPNRQWDALVSGGVDTSLIISGPTANFSKMKQQRLGIVPQKSPVSYSSKDRLMICHFDDSVRLWQLADPNIKHYDLFNGQRLPHDSFRHLITIKCRVSCF